MIQEADIVIGDVEKFSVVDFPNHIAAVVFLQGCPWRCPFCYNTSLQTIGGIPESDWNFEKFLTFLQKRKNVLDGVVFSGGEPLVHNGLPVAVRIVKEKGFSVGLHTGGYRPDILQKCVGLLDWVGLDIKAPLEAEHYKRATGGYSAAENIKKSLDILCRSGISFECRTTCDPRILKIDDLYVIANTLKAAGVKEFHLQKYRLVKTDTVTDESECNALIENVELLHTLQNLFSVFDVRK